MQEEIKLRKKAAYISLSVGVGMFIAKSGAYFITGSEAIFSDAAESVVHPDGDGWFCAGPGCAGQSGHSHGTG